MAILKNRVKINNNLIGFLKFGFFSIKKFSAFFLIFLCCYMLYFPSENLSKLSLNISGFVLSVNSKITHIFFNGIRNISEKAIYFKDLHQENIELKAKISELVKQNIEAKKALTENVELKQLLNIKDSFKGNYVSAKLVGVNITPFSSSAIAEVGEKENVKKDDLVLSHKGLIGKVINVTANYSSIMLLGDPNLRIPVFTLNSKSRGILAKQNSQMELIYLPEDHNLEVGELVYTSGDGKIYPKGLLVGIIHEINNKGVFVKLATDLNDIEFVNIEIKGNYH